MPTRELVAPPRLAFRAALATLYRSRLSRSGARYEPLASVELAG
jgi:2'-5' RNA ligase